MDNAEILHIISRIRSGETDAFRVIFREYQQMVFGLSLKIVRQRELAEEVTQDTFLKAFKALPQFKGQSKFSTWLFQIGYFTSINYLRKKRPVFSQVETNVPDLSDGILEEMDKASQREMIGRALSRLKPDERGLITLYYLDELTTEEIARITGLSLSNVKVKMLRCREKLRDMFVPKTKNELNSSV